MHEKRREKRKLHSVILLFVVLWLWGYQNILYFIPTLLLFQEFPKYALTFGHVASLFWLLSYLTLPLILNSQGCPKYPFYTSILYPNFILSVTEAGKAEWLSCGFVYLSIRLHLLTNRKEKLNNTVYTCSVKMEVKLILDYLLLTQPLESSRERMVTTYFFIISHTGLKTTDELVRLYRESLQ